MRQRLKVHDELTRVELDKLEAFCREKKRSVDEVHDWLLAAGYTISRTAAWNWKTDFDALVMQERFGRSGELANAIKGAVDKGSFDAVAEAAVMQLTQVVFEQANALQAEGEIDPLDVQRMTRSLRNLIGGKGELVKILAEKFEREMTKQLGLTTERKLTAEQIAQAGKAIFGS